MFSPSREIKMLNAKFRFNWRCFSRLLKQSLVVIPLRPETMKDPGGKTARVTKYYDKTLLT